MLRQRILTALVLMPLVVSGVLLLPSWGLAGLLALVVLLGADEWARLVGLGTCMGRVAFLLACGLGMLVLGWILVHDLPLLLPLFGLIGLGWLTMGWRLFHIPSIQPVTGVAVISAAIGLLILVSTWGGLVWLHLQPQGTWLMLWLLSLTWVADSGAYFAGRRWGRRKLAPLVSPGKTWAGVIGALVGGLLWGLPLAGWYGVGTWDRVGLLLLTLVTVAASIVGDLHESLLKRQRGLKDSGALLPGHGGMLDRIDSLTAAVPWFVLGMLTLRG